MEKRQGESMTVSMWSKFLQKLWPILMVLVLMVSCARPPEPTPVVPTPVIEEPGIVKEPVVEEEVPAL